jgi:hypothetical protein
MLSVKPPAVGRRGPASLCERRLNELPECIMADPRKGKRLALSPGRKMVLEILHHGCKVPALPLSKIMQVGALAAARRAGATVSWTAIFIRAYSLTARQHPELRRAYVPWPWPHLYEHPSSECALLLERDYQGENIVLGARLRTPEEQSLEALDAHLRRFRETPVMEVNYYRQWLRVGRLPRLLRRFLFWHSLNLSGFKRAKRLGTFAISSLGNLGVEQHHPISPLTTYLTYGPISPQGEVNVKIIYDHRVMDGRSVARCLTALEQVLNTQILTELLALAQDNPRRQAS